MVEGRWEKYAQTDQLTEGGLSYRQIRLHVKYDISETCTVRIISFKNKKIESPAINPFMPDVETFKFMHKIHVWPTGIQGTLRLWNIYIIPVIYVKRAIKTIK